jgi:hypothetical protein
MCTQYLYGSAKIIFMNIRGNSSRGGGRGFLYGNEMGDKLELLNQTGFNWIYARI